MKKEYQILLIFISIIALSGVMIYIIMAQNVKAPLQAEQSMPAQQTTDPMQMPPGPDQAKIKQQITEMEAALKNSPNDYTLLVELGNAYYDLSEPPKSIEYYEKALKIKADDASVIVDLGAMYRQSGDPDKALALFNKAITIDPKLPQAYFNLGMVLKMEKNDPKGAAKAWQKYLELDPNSEAKQFLEDEIKKAGSGGK
jgi:tetratricopeptide (TPR) repeat protein